MSTARSFAVSAAGRSTGWPSIIHSPSSSAPTAAARAATTVGTTPASMNFLLTEGVSCTRHWRAVATCVDSWAEDTADASPGSLFRSAMVVSRRICKRGFSAPACTILSPARWSFAIPPSNCRVFMVKWCTPGQSLSGWRPGAKALRRSARKPSKRISGWSMPVGAWRSCCPQGMESSCSAEAAGPSRPTPRSPSMSQKVCVRQRPKTWKGPSSCTPSDSNLARVISLLAAHRSPPISARASGGTVPRGGAIIPGGSTEAGMFVGPSMKAFAPALVRRGPCSAPKTSLTFLVSIATGPG
mmetsp:Transcript_63898/g.202184  ORF Transcript_63898/g.202184 Transcript_63898/m.202184 type:complete len:299 (-) Transcript_63898:219-1115(-)